MGLMKAAPDSFWSYVVLFSAMMNHFIIFGIGMSFSLFFKVLMDNFESSRATTAWFNSIQSGVFYFSGPLVSVLLKRYDWRTLITAGAIFNGVGLTLSFFAQSIYFLYISIGLIVGLGFGLVHVSAVVAVGAYFTKTNQRSFAQGLSLTGGSLGTLVMPVLTFKLIVRYGFRGAFLVLGGLMFQTLVFGCLILPFPASALGPKIPKPPARKKFLWTMPADRGNRSGAAKVTGRDLEAVLPSGTVGAVEGSLPLLGGGGGQGGGASLPRDHHRLSELEGAKDRTVEESLDLSGSRLTFDPVVVVKEVKSSGTVKSGDTDGQTLKQSDLFRNPTCLLFILQSASWTSSIFIVMHLLFDFLIADRHIAPAINAAWIFSVIMMSAMAGNLFAAILGIFLAPPPSSKTSLSSKALGSRSRLAVPHLTKCWIFNFCTIFHGLLATPLFLCSRRYDMLCLIAVSFGFPYGIKMALGPTVCVDLFGLQNLPFIYGYTMLACGTGILVAPPLGGYLVDVTKNYVVTFWLSACLSGLAFVLFSILLVLEQRKSVATSSNGTAPDRPTLREVYGDCVKPSDSDDTSLLEENKMRKALKRMAEPTPTENEVIA